jgi:hypothetical protein
MVTVGVSLAPSHVYWVGTLLPPVTPSTVKRKATGTAASAGVVDAEVPADGAETSAASAVVAADPLPESSTVDEVSSESEQPAASIRIATTVMKKDRMSPVFHAAQMLVCFTAPMRLRQIALVAEDLRPVEQEIIAELGLELCFRDPGIAEFGLRHGLFPIGDRLLEVVVPKQEGTTAGRLLERRGGDGGYMVLLQTDDVDREQARLEAAGMRIVYVAHGKTIKGLHIHPKDVGGAILSIDQADPPESWEWGGFDWEYHSRSDVITDLVAAELQAEDPDAMAERWSIAVDVPVVDRTITLDDGELRFVAASDGRGDGLAAVDVVATDRSRAGETINICGTGFNLV